MVKMKELNNILSLKILWLHLATSLSHWSDWPRSGSPLCIQVNRWNTETNKAGEERLLHVGELLESHVLYNWRKLVVITNHDPSLQTIVSILRNLLSKKQSIKCQSKQTLLHGFSLRQLTFV